MSLGGGTWTAHNKALPGSYINFVSAARASSALSDRGIATIPMEFDWAPDGEVFTVTAEQFQKDSLKIFGHAYTDEEMRPLRELFANIQIAHLYKLNTGTKAKNDLAEARHTGARGNALKIVIAANESSTEEAPVYDVSTYLDTTCVDIQTGITQAVDLQANEFVIFKPEASLAVSASTPLTGGANGTTENEAYQAYLDKIEAYSFHTMGCTSVDETVKGLFAAFTKRLREDCGIKFQTVLFRYAKADYEGVISVENGLADDKDSPSMVYWTTGAQAGCAVNNSLTNTAYTGEYTADTSYTQAQLTAAIKAGKLLYHRVSDTVRVLTDINTFTSASDEKSADFSSNQTVRVLDQIGNDIAALFNDKYLGKVPNDNAGRISLWNDIVKHHEQMQNIRAIEDFLSDNITVARGDTKKSVVVTDHVTPTNAMEQLYMTVVVE